MGGRKAAGPLLPFRVPCPGTCCDLSGPLSCLPAGAGATEAPSHPNGASARGRAPLALASGFPSLTLPQLGEALTAGVQASLGQEGSSYPLDTSAEVRSVLGLRRVVFVRFIHPGP